MIDKKLFNEYIQAFLEENSKVNLISKNDEKFLWEKHIFDSLSLKMFFDKYGMPEEMLDIGTGGGFPSIPVAIAYPTIKITALDSINKKIRAIDSIKLKLNLNNINTICNRIENIQDKFDLVTARAVASLNKICTFALPKVKSNGYFVAYKSKKYQEEIDDAKDVLKKYNAKIIDIIEYKLPINQDIKRNLIVIKK